jgi:activator of 2-hydroxyglutaryl-CoA dehydratase
MKEAAHFGSGKYMHRDQIPAFHQEYSGMTLSIGIDIRTSAVKAVLLENGNRLIAASLIELPVPMIYSPRIEQDPSD